MVVVVLLLSACVDGMAKCPVVTVIVNGRLNASIDNRVVEVRVVLGTPKGQFEEGTILKSPDFTLLVRFPTLKSYSALFGHSCSNFPDSVLVTAKADGKIIAEKKMSLQRDFQSMAPNEFHIRGGIILDAPGGGDDARVPPLPGLGRAEDFGWP